MSSEGALKTPRLPSTMTVPGSGVSMVTPNCSMAFAVLRQSSPSRKLVIVQRPLEIAERRIARCEMLLSPGTVSSVSIAGARRTFRVFFAAGFIRFLGLAGFWLH